MLANVNLVLRIAAFLLVLIYALGGRAPKVDLGWLGLALFIASSTLA